jgi:nucleotide-binding universal stress UspA family protein
VATDGSSRSDAAVRAALKISSVSGQKVLVLAVHAPLPVMGPEVQLATSPSMDAQSRAALLGQVADQLDRVGITDWPVKVASGYPAATIASLAKTIDASFIIMGLGGHGMLERVFGDEMALQVLRVGTVPVLAVAENFQDLPERALGAMDFSASSKRALELGAPFVRARGNLTLAHVIASGTDPINLSKMDRSHVGALGRALKRVTADVDFADGVTCEHRLIAGDPASELLKLAAELHADLIITGSHGHNFLNRLLLGSVSTQLLRKAGCSILVVPPRAEPAFVAAPAEPHERFGSYEWAERLEEFTRRNIWRRARLEVIDPEIGAQVEEEDVPFIGASFDPRNAHVHLMFGSRNGGREHLTHNIDGVTVIQTLRDRTGKDVFLRIGHGSGQTLLTLER